MTEGKVERPKRHWVLPLLAALVGIAATVLVGWYQVSRAEKEAALAEQERARAVRQNLVSIIEEHVLNDKRIELARLARLVDQRRREERVASIITVSEVLEEAEFNILNTRYLPFEKKQGLKPVFDALYAELSTRTFAPYTPETRNADLLNELARQIQESKSTEAIESLKRLQESHAKDLEAAKSERRALSLRQIADELFKDPKPLLIMSMAYITFIFWFLIIRRRFPRILRVLLAETPVGKDKDDETRKEERNKEAS